MALDIIIFVISLLKSLVTNRHLRQCSTYSSYNRAIKTSDAVNTVGEIGR